MKINNLTSKAAMAGILKLNAGIHFLTGVPKCTPLFFTFVEYR
mgnify:CR=1 FL=1